VKLEKSVLKQKSLLLGSCS